MLVSIGAAVDRIAARPPHLGKESLQGAGVEIVLRRHLQQRMLRPLHCVYVDSMQRLPGWRACQGAHTGAVSWIACVGGSSIVFRHLSGAEAGQARTVLLLGRPVAQGAAAAALDQPEGVVVAIPEQGLQLLGVSGQGGVQLEVCTPRRQRKLELANRAIVGDGMVGVFLQTVW